MKVTRVSQLTGIEHSLDLPVTEQQLQLWELGELIQDVMPNLTPAQREFLMTGIIEEEWDHVFLDNDEEDEADHYDYTNSKYNTYDDGDEDSSSNTNDTYLDTYDDSDD